MGLRVYQDLITEYPAAHLVAGVVDAMPLLMAEDVLTRLLAALEPSEDYAVATEIADVPTVLCAFRFEADADRFAAVFRAQPTDLLGEFSSCRAFHLNVQLAKAITKASAQRRRR